MQNRNSGPIQRIVTLVAVIGTFSLAACEDDPVDVGGHDEGDVAGFRLERIMPDGGRETVYTYDGPTGADTLFLTEGTQVDVEIRWLDEDGDVIELDDEEHDWELIENSSAIVSFSPSDSESWQGTFTTTPLLPGATVYGAFYVTLFHGEEEEFETPGLVVATQG